MNLKLRIILIAVLISGCDIEATDIFKSNHSVLTFLPVEAGTVLHCERTDPDVECVHEEEIVMRSPVSGIIIAKSKNLVNIATSGSYQVIIHGLTEVYPWIDNGRAVEQAEPIGRQRADEAFQLRVLNFEGEAVETRIADSIIGGEVTASLERNMTVFDGYFTQNLGSENLIELMPAGSNCSWTFRVNTSGTYNISVESEAIQPYFVRAFEREERTEANADIELEFGEIYRLEPRFEWSKSSMCASRAIFRLN